MKTEYQIKIIQKLCELRKLHNYSQIHLASELGISVGQLGNIESSKYPHKYTLSQIYQISKLFDIPIEQIFIEKSELESCSDVINLLVTKIISYEK